MWNEPSAKRLAQIPKLYETEGIDLKEKLVYLHFFIGGCDWYVTEFDGEDLFFGYAILNQDYQNAEWGYFSFSELKAIQVGPIEIDCEIECLWAVKKAGDIPEIWRKS